MTSPAMMIIRHERDISAELQMDGAWPVNYREEGAFWPWGALPPVILLPGQALRLDITHKGNSAEAIVTIYPAAGPDLVVEQN